MNELTEAEVIESLEHGDVMQLWIAMAAEGTSPDPYAVALTEQELREMLWRIEHDWSAGAPDLPPVPADWWPDDVVIQRVPGRFVFVNHFGAPKDVTGLRPVLEALHGPTP